MTSLPKEIAIQNAEGNPSKANYDAVKMKYFKSLGLGSKERSNTNPEAPHSLPSTSPLPEHHPRSKSNPIPIVPQAGATIRNSDEREYEEEEEELQFYEEEEEEFIVGSPTQGKKNFIPPHQLVQAQYQQTSFQVGTAHSVAVWEKSRRNAFSKTS